MAIVPLQKAIQYIDNNEPLLAQLYSTLGDAFYTLKIMQPAIVILMQH